MSCPVLKGFWPKDFMDAAYSVRHVELHNAEWHSKACKRNPSLSLSSFLPPSLSFFLSFLPPSLSFFLFLFFFFFFFCFLGLHLWQMEIPRLGGQLELQLLATAMQDPSCICNLHHSSQQCQIPDPLSEVRDWTRILMDTRWIRFHCATNRNSQEILFVWFSASKIDWDGEPHLSTACAHHIS